MRAARCGQNFRISEGLGVDLKTKLRDVDRPIDRYFKPEFGGVIIGLPLFGPDHRLEPSQSKLIIGTRGRLVFARGGKSNIPVPRTGRSTKIDRDPVRVALVACNDKLVGPWRQIRN